MLITRSTRNEHSAQIKTNINANPHANADVESDSEIHTNPSVNTNTYTHYGGAGWSKYYFETTTF